MSKSTEVATRPTQALDPFQTAEHFVKSGWFKDATDPSKAVVKILAGQEMGIGPMASMQGIHIIEGKPSLSANLLAAQVKRHPAYDYIVREHLATGCRIEFLQNGDSIGVSEFTTEDAEWAGVAGKSNWKRYPKAMMFARALSQGVRWYCPDVTAGSPAYVPEELGAEVEADGGPVKVAAEVVEPEIPAADKLDPDRVATIIQGFSALGLDYNAIELLLGSASVDGLRARSKKAAQERIEGLTPEQADAVEAELQREADDQQEADGV